MTRLEWGTVPPMYYYGIDQGVLYLDDAVSPWGGLVLVEETTESEMNSDHYFEGRRLHISVANGPFKARVGAYMFPEVFSTYNGYNEQQIYRRFGFSYRTQLAHSHQIHVVYGALIRKDSRVWVTDNQSPQPALFSWDIYADAVDVPGARPSAHLVLESPNGSNVLEQAEDILYGTSSSEPRLPDPSELIALYESASMLKIVNHQDGTWTATGPDDVVKILSDGLFEIEASTAYFLNSDLFVVNSE